MWYFKNDTHEWLSMRTNFIVLFESSFFHLFVKMSFTGWSTKRFLDAHAKGSPKVKMETQRRFESKCDVVILDAMLLVSETGCCAIVGVECRRHCDIAVSLSEQFADWLFCNGNDFISFQKNKPMTCWYYKNQKKKTLVI